jgi:hypothetical protein
VRAFFEVHPLVTLARARWLFPRDLPTNLSKAPRDFGEEGEGERALLIGLIGRARRLDEVDSKNPHAVFRVCFSAIRHLGRIRLRIRDELDE